MNLLSHFLGFFTKQTPLSVSIRTIGVLFIILGLLHTTGLDPIFAQSVDKNQKNLQKYAQAHFYLTTHYYKEIDLEELHIRMIKNIIHQLDDSTLITHNTPLDTLYNYDFQNQIEALQAFEQAYFYVHKNDSSQNMQEFTDLAVKYLIDGLDPHSFYINKKRFRSIEEDFSGKFQGIGVEFNIIRDTITVINAIDGGPSALLGIRSGDRIVSINDSSAIGFTNRQVIQTLRGPKGSQVKVTIKRPSYNYLLDFSITRDNIPLYTIDSSYMLDKKTGYIKINRFAQTTYDEFITEAIRLEKKGMKRMILDLRNNPGGYMDQALKILEEFFPSQTFLLSTKGRYHRYNANYLSRRTGNLLDMPIIIYINEGSASASEIVSGAIQDYDRGLIIGKRSFGKGLVQRQFELPDSSAIRLTSSRYYTPSGRLIQKDFDDTRSYHNEVRTRSSATQDAIKFTEEIDFKQIYYTSKGRKVYGGGGIIPDITIDTDTTLSVHLFNFMMSKGVHFSFVRNYIDKYGDSFRKKWEHQYDKFRTSFNWSKSDRSHFGKALQKAGLVFYKKKKQKEQPHPEFKGTELHISDNDFKDSVWICYSYMKAELARQIWGHKYFYQIVNDAFDETFKKMDFYWDEVEKLKQISIRQPVSDN